MLHLISITGSSAPDFYLEKDRIADFKSLLRSLTSGRAMVISTRFRTDLLFSSETTSLQSVLKSLALYVELEVLPSHQKDIQSVKGDEAVLFRYFEGINKLAQHWHEFQIYRRAFQAACETDNPVTRTVLLCDKYLLEHPSIKRAPLVDPNEIPEATHESDTFELAMRIINNESRSN